MRRTREAASSKYRAEKDVASSQKYSSSKNWQGEIRFYGPLWGHNGVTESFS